VRVRAQREREAAEAAARAEQERLAAEARAGETIAIPQNAQRRLMTIRSSNSRRSRRQG
jgi:hypothetical protein